MQDTKTRSLIDRILPGTTVHSAVAALKGLKVEKRHRITLFGYLMLVVALLAGTLASRLLLL